VFSIILLGHAAKKTSCDAREKLLLEITSGFTLARLPSIQQQRQRKQQLLSSSSDHLKENRGYPVRISTIAQNIHEIAYFNAHGTTISC
jgi:DNA-binding LytR/AlgR family response regulator